MGKPVPELLSPAADVTCLVAAVENGCDAVYVGGKDFSARKGAPNFTQEELQRALDYCHLRGVRVYIAVNTLCKQQELGRVYDFIDDMYKAGADAFITADFGVAKIVSEHFPLVELHASTQMTVDSYEGAVMLAEAGFSRVVLARELTLAQIQDITYRLQVSGANITPEIFAHGSMCYSYSGRCLMSGLIGERSGNRGSCAQPCRLDYALTNAGTELAYGALVSMRDMCTLPILQELVQTGVSALKIEGRQKSPQYVAAVTRAYRRSLRAIQEGAVEHQALLAEQAYLARIFCRDGQFGRGYLKQDPHRHLLCERTPKHLGKLAGHITGSLKPGLYTITAATDLIAGDGLQTFDQEGESCGGAVQAKAASGEGLQINISGILPHGTPLYKSFDKAAQDAASETFSRQERKLTLQAKVWAKHGHNLTLELSRGAISVLGQGAAVQVARGAPVSVADILGRLSRTGDTPFRLDFVEDHIDPGIFLPVSAQNHLRRQLCESFAKEYAASFRRKGGSTPSPAKSLCKAPPGKSKLSVFTHNVNQLDAVLDLGGVSRFICQASQDLLLDLDAFASRAHKAGAELFVALPCVGATGYALEDVLATVEPSLADGYLLTNWGHITATSATSKQRASDASLAVMNRIALEALRPFVSTIALCQELTLEEAAAMADISCEITVHGRQIAYLARICPISRLTGGGKNCRAKDSFENYALVDRKGLTLPIIRDCNLCSAQILSGRCVSMLDKMSEITGLGIGYLRLSFTEEPPQVAAAVTDAYTRALLTPQTGGANFDPVVTQHYNDGLYAGSFYRGVT